MTDNLPSVTVLIPTRPEQAEIPAVAAARLLDYPPEKLEILLARGRQPSVQRNRGLNAASGALVYFLDDDSIPRPGDLHRAVEHFRDAKVMVVGGPNICPKDAPALEQVFALVLSSWLAFGPSRARYASFGAVRDSSEKELILCNMLARRLPLLELGGFNEALYPNEENALMDELQKRGGRLLYDPDLVVYRRPRSSLKSFCRMLMTYGRGRAEQFREHPTLGSVLNFVPPLFLIYLLALPALLGVFGRWPVAIFLVYAIAVVVQVLVLFPRGGLARSVATLPLIILTHLLYGWGFWRGLFTRLNPHPEGPTVSVQLEKIEASRPTDENSPEKERRSLRQAPGNLDSR